MAQLQVAIEAWGPAGLELDTDDAACPYSVEVMSDETLDELKRLPGWNGKPIEGAQVDGVISVRRDRLEDGCAIGTLAHELGHLMGLPHSEESGSVMVEEQDSVCAMPAPTAEDYRVMRGLL